MKNDLKAILKKNLSPEELALVYKSYDVIGDIAVIRVPEQLLSLSETIAEALVQQHKHVKAVWQQSSPVSGDFRLRKLEWVAGEKKTETVHKEHGCLFKVDIKECYFSPRLAFERMRIANLVKDNEVVVNMFAGVGCYSIIIAKHSKAAKIYSIDINPVAVKYMRENVLLNKVVDKVLPIEGNAGTIIESTLKNTADRVIMPLPEKAYEYFDFALSAVKSQGGWIHYYNFEHAGKEESPIKKAKTKVAEKLQQQKVSFELPFGRIVRQTGPNWYQIAVDIQIGK
jgi:tRNA (guanine37-N1)-methyltransferase